MKTLKAKKEIILFDMDGVLLKPLGYHKALQDSAEYFGRCLGFKEVGLTQDDVHAFEAVGVTNEWVSLAICLTAMVEMMVEADKNVRIDHSIFEKPFALNGYPAPDFPRIIELLADLTEFGETALARAKRLFGEDLHWILDQAYRLDGLTHRVQQERVLGSEEFRNSYKLEPMEKLPSYLLKYDRSNLTDDLRTRLINWRDLPENNAIVFTNRPSISPDGKTGTPEAELGLQTVGLKDFEFASTGGVVWIEAEYGKVNGTYNKPHPLHALAAMRCALGDSAERAFRAAGRLTEEKANDGLWDLLSGARVIVFEDSAAGFTSLRVAKKLLAEINVHIEIELIGISENEDKQRSLRRAGAVVFPTLAPALIEFFELRGL